jgi:hypothetical protein
MQELKGADLQGRGDVHSLHRVWRSGGKEETVNSEQWTVSRWIDVKVEVLEMVTDVFDFDGVI